MKYIDKKVKDVTKVGSVPWKAFHFESNQAFGFCETSKKWRELKAAYIEAYGEFDASKVKQATYGKEGHHSEFSDNFGQRTEHQGDYTLADFANDNGMIL